MEKNALRGLVPNGSESPEPESSADVEIPELRKKEKERKAAGVFWGSGSPGAGANLFRAGAGGFSSPFGLGRIAAAIAQRIGGAGNVLGRLLLSRAGGWLLFSGIMGGGIAAGIFAGLMASRPTKVHAGAAALNLEDPRSAIVVNNPRDKSLSFVQNANQGELNFDDARASALKPEEVAAAAEAAPPPSADPGADEIGEVSAEDDPLAQAQALADAAGSGQFGKLGNMKGALASNSGFGGGRGAMGNFKNPFQAKLPQMDKGRGKMAAMQKSRRAMKGTDLRQSRGRASKAMGQLKLARFMSGQAKTMAAEETSSQFAANAFEQSKTQGGEIPGMIGSGSPDVVVPPGSGAPDPMSMPTPPAVGPYQAVTPYQPQLDAAKNMGAAAGQLKMMGMMMLALGALMIVAGYNLLPGPWAWAVIAAGIALVAMGMMMLAQAQNMAAMAKQVAETIKAQTDQAEQAQIAAEAAQAKADGRDYTPPDLSDKTKNNDELHQRIEDERNADFTFDEPGSQHEKNTNPKKK